MNRPIVLALSVVGVATVITATGTLSRLPNVIRFPDVGQDDLLKASKWLAGHEDISGLIVNSGFGEVPLLVYHNVKNSYPAMLDPAFFFNFDPKGFRAWGDILVAGMKNWQETGRVR